MDWPKPATRYAEYVRKVKACGHWEYDKSTGRDKAVLRHKSGATVAYNLHDGGNDWNGARNFAAEAGRACGCKFIESRGRKKSRKKIETSGFSLDAATREQRTFHAARGEDIERHTAERDRLVEEMRDAARSGKRERICGIRDSLRRVREIEADLSEKFHQHIEPFDVNELAQEATA